MFKHVLSFLLGAGVGSAAMALLLKRKYELEAKAEVDALKEYYNRKQCPDKVESPEERKEEKIFKTTNEKPDIMDMKKDYNKVVNYNGYSKESKAAEKPKIDWDALEKDDDILTREEREEEEAFVNVFPKEGPSDRPFTITPDEFATDRPYYDKITLTYYLGDDTLCDDCGDPMNDQIGSTVGETFRNYIGEYEDGVAYVRNEKLACDYEIIQENCSWHSED